MPDFVKAGLVVLPQGMYVPSPRSGRIVHHMLLLMVILSSGGQNNGFFSVAAPQKSLFRVTYPSMIASHVRRMHLATCPGPFFVFLFILRGRGRDPVTTVFVILRSASSFFRRRGGGGQQQSIEEKRALSTVSVSHPKRKPMRGPDWKRWMMVEIDGDGSRTLSRR